MVGSRLSLNYPPETGSGLQSVSASHLLSIRPCKVMLIIFLRDDACYKRLRSLAGEWRD
jgi:hypothetical protein